MEFIVCSMSAVNLLHPEPTIQTPLLMSAFMGTYHIFSYENAPPNIRLLSDQSNIWGAIHYCYRAIFTEESVKSLRTWCFYFTGKPTEIMFQ